VKASVPFDPLAFNAAALMMRSHRQQVLASNLANADTPGYQARDIDFESALRDQVAGTHSQGALALAATDTRHITAGGAQGDAPALLYRTVMQPAIDGNTVDPDVERAHFAENTTGFETAAALLGATIKSRQMAINGQP